MSRRDERTLTTARLRLRAPRATDAARIAALAADYDILKNTLRMPHPYRREDAEVFIESCATQDPDREQTFVLEAAREGPLGVLGFFVGERPGTELGYWIGRPYWGRGYASEAVEAALRWADGEWRRRVVWAGHFADNPISGRVLEKAGFLYTGVVESRFSRARGEPAATRLMVRLA
jgi:RimJ/RimL family protein N-acetyltransferase